MAKNNVKSGLIACSYCQVVIAGIAVQGEHGFYCCEEHREEDEKEFNPIDLINRIFRKNDTD